MINTNAFDYINVLDKAADAAGLRNDAIAILQMRLPPAIRDRMWHLNRNWQKRWEEAVILPIWISVCRE